MLPGARRALRRIGDAVDVVTYLGEYFKTRLAPAFGPHPDLVQLTPGVDVETFRPSEGDDVIRSRYGLAGRALVVCVSRLVARKGQDTLIAAMPQVRRAVPGTALLLVGAGKYRDRLEALAADEGCGATCRVHRGRAPGGVAVALRRR